jgi:malate permease
MPPPMPSATAFPPRPKASPLAYIGATVTPLSLLYIGITLCDAGLASIRFDRDTIAALLGKFVFAPLLMFVLIYFGKSWLALPTAEAKTFGGGQDFDCAVVRIRVGCPADSGERGQGRRALRHQCCDHQHAALCGGRAAGGLAAGMAAPLNPFPSISS